MAPQNKITSHKLSTIAYAEGFLEDFIEMSTMPREIPEDMDPEEALNIADDNEHSAQVRAMWAVVRDGLRQLISDNQDLQNKITLIELAIKGGQV